MIMETIFGIILTVAGGGDKVAGAAVWKGRNRVRSEAARVEAEIARLSSRADAKARKRWGELVGHVFPEADNTV